MTAHNSEIAPDAMKESARSSTADNHSEPKIFRGPRHYVCQPRESDGGPLCRLGPQPNDAVSPDERETTLQLILSRRGFNKSFRLDSDWL